MKLDAVGVTSTDFSKSILFYEILGFTFGDVNSGEKHIESVADDSSIRLMIDSQELIANIIGETPKPGNHSNFAISYSHPDEVDQLVNQLLTNGFTVVKEPWDAFWGQRYAVVEDPDGYKVDLYAQLGSK